MILHFSNKFALILINMSVISVMLFKINAFEYYCFHANMFNHILCFVSLSFTAGGFWEGPAAEVGEGVQAGAGQVDPGAQEAWGVHQADARQAAPPGPPAGWHTAESHRVGNPGTSHESGGAERLQDHRGGAQQVCQDGGRDGKEAVRVWYREGTVVWEVTEGGNED